AGRVGSELLPIRVGSGSLPEPARFATAEGRARDRGQKLKDIGACIDDCEDDYDSCGRTPTCETAFHSCLSRCGITNPCTPDTQTTESTQYLGYQAVPNTYSCTSYFSSNVTNFSLFQLWGQKYRITTTTVETNIYCSQRTTVEVTYEYRFSCWKLVDPVSCQGFPPEIQPPYSLLPCA
ncbi:MAG: hypothetical protein MI919_40530, partial [Holophagales bacterium]|nr:hypothetical protein [Holophagales bacterium]